MPVMGVCPDCGYKFPLEQAWQDVKAREALKGALEMHPSLAGCIIAYLGLFSPAQRAMRMDALAARLNELSHAIKSAEVERNGQTWAAPISYWKESMEEMLGKREQLRLPLKDHNYLFAMVANKASAAAGRKEYKTEQNKKHRTGTSSGMQSAADVVTGEKKQSTHTPKEVGKAKVKDLKAQLKRRTPTDA